MIPLDLHSHPLQVHRSSLPDAETELSECEVNCAVTLASGGAKIQAQVFSLPELGSSLLCWALGGLPSELCSFPPGLLCQPGFGLKSA